MAKRKSVHNDKARTSRAEALAAIAAEFDRKIETFKEPETRARIDAVMNARGRANRRPKAGEGF